MFATVPLANASHKAILESVEEGTTKGHGERRGKLCGYFKNLPTTLSSTGVYAFGKKHQRPSAFCPATSLPTGEHRVTYLLKKGEKGKVKI